jgi:alkanesulfonate monooxygenase SsuD/methylene tetrahydromethanopterin reductase-like flavin-dependent oxidoreductase (luciferase family)
MSYFKRNPKGRPAYRARWAAAWAKMISTGAASPEEEDSMRRQILLAEAGVQSSSDLTEAGYTKVMMHLGSILGASEQQMRDPERARKIYRIEKIAEELRPADPDSYVRGVIDDMGLIGDASKWRTALLRNDVHKLMLSMVTQQRRVAKRVRERGSEGEMECGSDVVENCCQCAKPGPHFHPGANGKFCAVCGKNIYLNTEGLASTAGSENPKL